MTEQRSFCGPGIDAIALLTLHPAPPQSLVFGHKRAHVEGPMTEAEWLACEDPRPLLTFLNGRWGARKARLFGAANVRRAWYLLIDERSRRAVEVAERYADGRATERERAGARRAAGNAHGTVYRAHPQHPARTIYCLPAQAARLLAEKVYLPSLTGLADESIGRCACQHTEDETSEATGHAQIRLALTDATFVALQNLGVPSAVRDRLLPLGNNARSRSELVRELATVLGAEELNRYRSVILDWSRVDTPETKILAALVRDTFGNPFRPVALAPEWRTDTVPGIAHQMYESRDFAAMPILADALQDAGCDSADILDHCRGLGPHVRGCWVVDLLLAKE
jgi:hypothetical protein